MQKLKWSCFSCQTESYKFRKISETLDFFQHESDVEITQKWFVFRWSDKNFDLNSDSDFQINSICDFLSVYWLSEHAEWAICLFSTSFSWFYITHYWSQSHDTCQTSDKQDVFSE